MLRRFQHLKFAVTCIINFCSVFFFLFVFHFFLGLVHGVKFCSGVLRYNFKILAGVFIFCSVFFFFLYHFVWKTISIGKNNLMDVI